MLRHRRMEGEKTEDEDRTCHQPSVSQFFKGRCVLVTGATGFLGKVLLGRLLTECPDVGNILVMLRRLGGQSAQSRLEGLLNGPALGPLGPEQKSRLKAVQGDLSLEDLGIDPEEQKRICEQVEVVLHLGASYEPNLNATLKQALLPNLRGTIILLNLAKKMPNIKAFVYVSTISAHCDKEEVMEEMYPPPHDPKRVLSSAEFMEEEALSPLTNLLLAGKPNTYALSKALSENEVADYAQFFPVAIVRPFIVGSAWQWPVPGWVDSEFGPASLVAAYGQGLLGVARVQPSAHADFIPVDFCAHLVLVAAWRLWSMGTEASGNKVLLLHSSSQHSNPMPWGMFRSRLHRRLTSEDPFPWAMRYPGGIFLDSLRLHRILDLFLHYIPALVIDTAAKAVRRKPTMVQDYHKLSSAGRSMEYVTIRTRKVGDHQTRALWKLLSPEDQKKFPFDVCQVDWSEWVANYGSGVRAFLYPNSSSQESKEASRVRMRRLLWCNCGGFLAVVLLLAVGLFLLIAYLYA